MTVATLERPLTPADDEVSALIEALHETAQRLEELTAGEIDTVASLDGKTFLLRHAQDQLRHSEAAKQAAILDALPAYIALISHEGLIISVNEAWRKFDRIAEVACSPGYGVGANYLAICDGASLHGAADQHEIAEGVRSVLDGTAKYFSAEYEFHSAGEQCWFLMTATPLSADRRNGAVVMHLDITERKRHAVARQGMEIALLAEKERAQVTLNSIGDAVVCTDTAGNITFLNFAAETISGWSRMDALNRPMLEVLQIVDATTRLPIPDRMAIVVTGEFAAQSPSNSILIRQDGTEIPIEYSSALIHDHQGDGAGEVIVFRDVSAARTMSLQLVHNAHHDFLTGLPNRLLLRDRISQAIVLAPRHLKKVAVLYLDLDGFKHINDSLGHSIGDKLLKSIAQRLVAGARISDTVSRLGGDEFVVLLPDIDQSEEAAKSARRMLQSIAEMHSIDEHDLHITASIGISVYPDDGLDAETLIKNADTAMYQAKDSGRQGYRFFMPAMNIRAVERQSIEESLRRALDRKEFSLHYQPKIHLDTGSISGAEALIRWTHPTRGTVSPSEFISVAEDCGLILPIGAWVLREACLQGRAWEDAGLPVPTIAVNVSAMQFRHENFLDGVLATLDETGFDPHHLELELTESVLMKHAEFAASVLLALKKRGVQVSIDDFGTGYSSLSYLRTFAVDALKIDQSFVRQISTAGDAPIVTAVIAMAKSLKLRVIAEGVESLEEVTFLRSQKCDEAQGYYFSPPVPARQFEMLLKASIGSRHLTSQHRKQIPNAPFIPASPMNGGLTSSAVTERPQT